MPPVHPRSRGEHPLGPDRLRVHVGSSPLARGTLPRLHPRRHLCRFIPARAGNTRRSSDATVPVTVHPRSRGEHPPYVQAACSAGGSSPLARGTHIADATGLSRGRFIPARAGNTASSTSRQRSASVHPRSRGEHQPIACRRGARVGSSPLARGTRAAGRASRWSGRFIPARAGNTRWLTKERPRSSVHPRSRGEHREELIQRRRAAGSSPLARGTRGTARTARAANRFIPARAGNTMWSSISTAAPTVHPRSRGEHFWPAPGAALVAGSSPLARGTRLRPRERCGWGRFIPARAGNTAPSPAASTDAAVHPRSRGEHPMEPVVRWRCSGSSPLARGTRVHPGPEPSFVRFIPARAGNTSRRGRRRTSRPVHPRSRGEHAIKMAIAVIGIGSSPLARGTPGDLCPECDWTRFIPARAGNTRGRRSAPTRSPVHPRSRGEHVM